MATSDSSDAECPYENETTSTPELPPTDLASTVGRVPAPGPDDVLPLYTPAQAAEMLTVPESWLRRRAGERAVPCTLVGRYLRFSHADVIAIATAGAQPGRGSHAVTGRVPGGRARRSTRPTGSGPPERSPARRIGPMGRAR